MLTWYIIGCLILLAGCLLIYLSRVIAVHPPRIQDRACEGLERVEHAPDFYTLGNHWFRRSATGLYELYVEGSAFERGVAGGKLARELIGLQEEYFVEQIVRMVPSPFYLRFLKYLVAWFNRKLPLHVTEEYQREIFGFSRSAPSRYAYVGKPYQRMLNYHAAHDIGHALHNLAMVGCTSFGTWDKRSLDGNLIIGRNFDFYAGDKFAENKIVLFQAPDKGYRFISVTWGGFIGVVSGMNEKGLTVTINAAKSRIPRSAATPVSLVAREILQYAKNIAEAAAIASQRKMFVSESFLIGSAEDGKAVILEKTPHSMEIYDPGADWIACANHFQSEGLGETRLNTEDMEASASPYRFRRLRELMEKAGQNTVEKTVAILRDFRGMDDADIGYGNEKTLNQFICHHSVVFEPVKRKIWVSTGPWQLGPYVCYDLNAVFARGAEQGSGEIRESIFPEDPFIETDNFRNVLSFRALSRKMADGEKMDPDTLIACNREYFHAYVLAGDYAFGKGQVEQAFSYYTLALTREIATRREDAAIRKKIVACGRRLEKKERSRIQHSKTALT